jgi:mRNA-degrading endonuclease RelE of RelBE toxin-antitoxin system
MAPPKPPERQVLATPRFLRSKRSLSDVAQKAVDEAVSNIMQDPLKGEAKTGALKGVRVVKFTVEQQHYLLAYQFFSKRNVIDVLDIAPHENFYRDLQKYLGAR